MMDSVIDCNYDDQSVKSFDVINNGTCYQFEVQSLLTQDNDFATTEYIDT